VSGASLYLASAETPLEQSFVRRSGDVTVLRTPYDAQRTGVVLNDHPDVVERITTATFDAVTVPSTDQLDVSGASTYRGAWAPSTSYVTGDLVDHATGIWKALSTHVSTGAFAGSFWQSLSTGYLFAEVPDDPSGEGLYSAHATGIPGRLGFDRPGAYAGAYPARVTFVLYAATATTPVPRLAVPHPHLSGVSVIARRATPRRVLAADGTLTYYPEGESVLEGVDYQQDAETGTFTVLSPWSVGIPARASYSWRYEVARRSHTWRGAYAPAVSYVAGDIVEHLSAYYIVTETHVSDGVFDARYIAYVEPVKTNTPRFVREMALWGVDTLVDNQRVYENFGYLLDRPRASSEAYRAFLGAVSRLFLLGPTFERLESALNTVAGLPVVRDDGEVLQGYSNGVDHTETGGRVYGLAQGSDGLLTASTSHLQSLSAPFLPEDLGASVSLLVAGRRVAYTISRVLNPETVELSPAPPVDAVDVQWAFTHMQQRDRLRVSGLGARFTDADVGKIIRFPDSNEPRNKGSFRILAVDDPATVLLETTYGLVDESGVTWDYSETGLQRVTTNRRVYTFPLDVPVRQDVAASGSFGSLTFRAFEALTTAFTVVDYLEDPTWWHHVLIPETLFNTTGARRAVTPEMVEHVYGALDGASYGDPGLFVGADDDRLPGQSRAGYAVWYGGPYLKLAFDPETPGAQQRDVGRHLVVRTNGFRGSFPILGIEADGMTLRLDRFPPPEAASQTAPVDVAVELPPLLFRRSVAFVVMDRALKYHCAYVRIDPNVGVSRELLGDVLRLVSATPPKHVYVFVESGTTFRDTVVVADEVQLNLNYALREPVRAPDTTARFGVDSLLRTGDCYTFFEGHKDITPTPLVANNMPVTLPSGVTAVASLVKVRFEAAARSAGHQPCEEVDYKVNYVTGDVTVLAGAAITPDPVRVHYVYAIRRVLNPGDPHDPGETAVVYGGVDPTFVRALGQSPDVTGLVDRAIQLTLGP
jgi:hypothetical protein